jgi:regulator of RNase E activity RraA
MRFGEKIMRNNNLERDRTQNRNLLLLIALFSAIRPLIRGFKKQPGQTSGENAVTTSVTGPHPQSLLEALARYDTPTICNAMEIVAPERRLIGYTTKPLVCPFPDLPPMVGYARTVTIRSVLQSGLPAAEQARRRIAYYEYVGTGHGPRITVIQDIDGADVGYGAFWGEVQSNVHKALGCLGVITDGSIRDIPQWAPGFQALAGSIGPSHAWVHAESFGGEVRVAGMTVRSDDLIHADRHGAIIIPPDIAAKLPDAAELCGRRETPILEIARSKDFTLEKLKEALKRSAEIH